MQKLEDLKITDCIYFNGYFLENLNKLRILWINNCKNINGECLKDLTNLEILYISENNKMKDDTKIALFLLSY